MCRLCCQVERKSSISLASRGVYKSTSGSPSKSRCRTTSIIAGASPLLWQPRPAELGIPSQSRQGCSYPGRAPERISGILQDSLVKPSWITIQKIGTQRPCSAMRE